MATADSGGAAPTIMNNANTNGAAVQSAAAVDPVSAIFDLLKTKWLQFIGAVSGVVQAFQINTTSSPASGAASSSTATASADAAASVSS